MLTRYPEGTARTCPDCGGHLSPLDERHYETLCEHVSAPNRQPSLKTGYGCTAEGCGVATAGVRWLEDGEGPYGAPWGFGVRHPPGPWHDVYHRKQQWERNGC
jgi:hypothetical protein